METNTDKIAKIMAEVGMDNTLQASTVKDVYEKFWKAVRFFVSSSTLPRIIIRKFGTFEPNVAHIEHQLRKIETKKSEGKDIKDKEKEGRFEKAKERIGEESKTRRHSTGKQKELQASTGNTRDLRSLSGEHSDPSNSLKGRNQGEPIERQEGNE